MEEGRDNEFLNHSNVHSPLVFPDGDLKTTWAPTSRVPSGAAVIEKGFVRTRTEVEAWPLAQRTVQLAKCRPSYRTAKAYRPRRVRLCVVWAANGGAVMRGKVVRE
jgi:hypothetical protein